MSYFRPDVEAMDGYVPGEQPQSGKFIKLNTNENPYPPSSAVARAVAQVAHDGLARYPDPMATAFRQSAADLFGLELDWILCGNGSDDILTILTRAFVGQRQRVRIPYPSYVLYETLAKLQGAQTEEIHFNADWSLPVTFSRDADELRVAFLPNPNSPSGSTISPQHILEIAERLPCPLVVDEAYADFADQNCLELVAECEKILVTRSLSKSYSLAGLRFGFLVGQPHLVRRLAKVKDSYNCDAMSIAGATAAINDQEWLEHNQAAIRSTRTRLTERMRQLGFSVQPSQANFVWCTRDEPVFPLYEQLKRQRILVRYMDYPGWGDGLRITVGTDQQIDACLQLLEAMV